LCFKTNESFTLIFYCLNAKIYQEKQLKEGIKKREKREELFTPRCSVCLDQLL
jgi:hypothetical protein